MNIGIDLEKKLQNIADMRNEANRLWNERDGYSKGKMPTNWTAEEMLHLAIIGAESQGREYLQDTQKLLEKS